MKTISSILALSVTLSLAACASDGNWNTASNDNTMDNTSMAATTGAHDPAYHPADNSGPQLRAGNDKTNIAAALSKQDQLFLQDASSGGMYEVQAGQKALMKSSDAHVKEIGQMMVDDHTKANSDLKALAQRKGCEISSLPTVDQLRLLSTLDGLNGTDFDKEYIDQQRRAHEDTIAKFQSEANNGYDRDTRDFAANMLPKLRGHLDMINNNNSRLGIER